MSIAISSIGAKVSVAFETVAGVRPTTGYIHLPKITSVPDLDPDPDTAETTSFDNLKTTSKRAMLQDLDVLSFSARMSQDLYDLYKGVGGLEETYATKQLSGLGCWVCIDLKELTKAYYLPVELVPLGISGFDFNVVIDNAVKFTATGDGEWGDKPVYSTETVSTVSVSGVTADDVIYAIIGSDIRAQVTATTTSATLYLPYDSVSGTVYTIASSAGKAASLTVDSASESVSLS